MSCTPGWNHLLDYLTVLCCWVTHSHWTGDPGRSVQGPCMGGSPAANLLNSESLRNLLAFSFTLPPLQPVRLPECYSALLEKVCALSTNHGFQSQCCHQHQALRTYKGAMRGEDPQHRFFWAFHTDSTPGQLCVLYRL